MKSQNNRFVGILIGIAILLLVPIIAMQFTKDVKWSFSDFVVAGALLLSTGLACELVLRTVQSMKYRIALCSVILLALVLVWLELAVGIFGTSVSGN